MFRLTRLLRPAALLLVAIMVSACAMQPGTATRPGSLDAGANETLRLAQATAKSGDYPTAARLYEQVLQQSPETVEALLGAGDVYARMGQLGRAETVLQRAHELAPRDAEILTVLARVYLSGKSHARALETYDKALRLDRANLSAMTGKGVTLDSLSRHAEAQEVYRRALQMHPTNYVLRSNYALSLALSGEAEHGASMLRELVRDPNAAPSVRDNLALVYGLMGRETDARAALALHMGAGEIDDNIAVYAALRRMMLEGKPIGALVFA